MATTKELDKKLAEMIRGKSAECEKLNTKTQKVIEELNNKVERVKNLKIDVPTINCNNNKINSETKAVIEELENKVERIKNIKVDIPTIN